MTASSVEKRRPWYSLRPDRLLTDNSSMKILALETSGSDCSAALLIGDHLEQRHRQAPRQHADLILEMLDALLREAALSLRDLDVIAYGRGPGSFTGVRIAAAVAQGIAFGAERPVIGVSTLAALARAASRQTDARRIACALDARMGEVYWGCFEIDAQKGLLAVGDEAVLDPRHTPELTGTGWCAAGSGWEVYPDLVHGHRAALTRPDGPDGPNQVQVISDARIEAGDVACLARNQLTEATPADRALPVYLRHQVTDQSRRSTSG